MEASQPYEPGLRPVCLLQDTPRETHHLMVVNSNGGQASRLLGQGEQWSLTPEHPEPFPKASQKQVWRRKGEEGNGNPLHCNRGPGILKKNVSSLMFVHTELTAPWTCPFCLLNRIVFLRFLRIIIP